MHTSFFSDGKLVYLVESAATLGAGDVERLEWLLGARRTEKAPAGGQYVGPRKEMLTPWSTNASEIASNVGVHGVSRIEAFIPAKGQDYDAMLEALYNGLSESTLQIEERPEPVRQIADIEKYNAEAALALSAEEIAYLKNESAKFGRLLTDSELFGFGQINSEHCRHKIFNGTFVIDGQEQPRSMFSLIKETSKRAPGNLISAYKDNVAFIKGSPVLEFSPARGDVPAYFRLRPIKSIISVKAETHNFPTTVEPFNGASTGSGGEIRDRMAGGRGSLPLVGTAVYMTAYPRLEKGREWEERIPPREWKYQTPEQILIKASNGASDFGNKFGQPLVAGSLLTYEMQASEALYAYDRTVMLAGGVGCANAEYALKHEVQPGDKVILLGGDNYRIGLAGGSVSSVDTGKYSKALELNAVQRANPEMQKRVYNVIRALAEAEDNPIKSIHDHGAGGHINCFSELLETLGGRIYIDKLPVGDPTLSVREILCNESQERMGLIAAPEHVERIRAIAERERAPMYVVGEVTGDKRFEFVAADGSAPVSLPMDFLFGSSPKTVIEDETLRITPQPISKIPRSSEAMVEALRGVLSLEGVACKDWLTNKVDRSVTGRVAQQQCVGPLQLPLADLGIAALDYAGTAGVCTSIGHAPGAALLDEAAGSVLSIAEALTNIVFCPLEKGLDSVVLSANWMWPAKNAGENARLYRAVEAASQFAVELGIAIPTGKDSLSMTMKYGAGKDVRAPGTVVISAAGQTLDYRKVVTPDLKPVSSSLLYLNMSGMKENPLGGSSYSQVIGVPGDEVPNVADAKAFRKAFNALQDLITEGVVLAGHDVSSGGLITALCEMAFGGDAGIEILLPEGGREAAEFLFCEKPGVVLQIANDKVEGVSDYFSNRGFEVRLLGAVSGRDVTVDAQGISFSLPVADLLKVWFRSSYLLDRKQTEPSCAEQRFETITQRHLNFRFPPNFDEIAEKAGVERGPRSESGIRAAIIREKGTNGDREMAYSLYAAGFDVKDVTVSDLTSGREDLRDLNFIVFPGGFSNSDVLGAGKGWAGVFRFNERALKAVKEFYARPDTLSLGVCNGCQFVAALELLYPEHGKKIEMRRNASKKFESAFINVDIEETKSILLKPLIGSRLGIWVAHGEGRFSLPMGERAYDIAMRYSSSRYPMNPNGADFNAAGVVSPDGRHLVMMPHLERSMFPSQWGCYPANRKGDSFTPWMLAFTAARDWVRGHTR